MRPSASDGQVYFNLRAKAEESPKIQKAFPGYEVVYGFFSKSGFTQRLLDVAREK